MGGKFGKHTSTDKDIGRRVRHIQGLAGVKKVVLGPFANCRHRYGAGDLRLIKEGDGFMQLRAYAGEGLRDLYVYFTDQVAAASAVRALCKEAA